MPVQRIVLVDDNPAMLETLAEMLEEQFAIVGKFSSGASLLADVGRLNPDIILLDISLGDMTGFFVAKRLQKMGCAARIIFLSVHENPDFVQAAFELGASGYVFKSQISFDLMNALEEVSQGRRYVPVSSPSSTNYLL